MMQTLPIALRLIFGCPVGPGDPSKIKHFRYSTNLTPGQERSTSTCRGERRTCELCKSCTPTSSTCCCTQYNAMLLPNKIWLKSCLRTLRRQLLFLPTFLPTSLPPRNDTVYIPSSYSCLHSFLLFLPTFPSPIPVYILLTPVVAHCTLHQVPEPEQDLRGSSGKLRGTSEKRWSTSGVRDHERETERRGGRIRRGRPWSDPETKKARTKETHVLSGPSSY